MHFSTSVEVLQPAAGSAARGFSAMSSIIMKVAPTPRTVAGVRKKTWGAMHACLPAKLKRQRKAPALSAPPKVEEREGARKHCDEANPKPQCPTNEKSVEAPHLEGGQH